MNERSFPSVAVTAVTVVSAGIFIGLGVWMWGWPASFSAYVNFPIHVHFLHDMGVYHIGLAIGMLVALFRRDAIYAVLVGLSDLRIARDQPRDRPRHRGKPQRPVPDRRAGRPQRCRRLDAWPSACGPTATGGHSRSEHLALLRWTLIDRDSAVRESVPTGRAVRRLGESGTRVWRRQGPGCRLDALPESPSRSGRACPVAQCRREPPPPRSR
jgi:hypothetical protein